jgi:hypothetical protein
LLSQTELVKESGVSFLQLIGGKSVRLCQQEKKQFKKDVEPSLRKQIFLFLPTIFSNWFIIETSYEHESKSILPK